MKAKNVEDHNKKMKRKRELALSKKGKKSKKNRLRDK